MGEGEESRKEIGEMEKEKEKEKEEEKEDEKEDEEKKIINSMTLSVKSCVIVFKD